MTNIENEPLLTTALYYAKEGFPVFATSPFSKIPRKNSKGFKEATTDHEIIFETFMNEPMANIGISIEHSEYFVVDCDRNHADGQDGIQSLMNLSNSESLPDNVIAVKTPSSGLHFWFKKPKGIEINHQIGFKDGIDILTYWVMAPKSRIKKDDGTVGEYELIKGSLTEATEPPKWLLEAITDEQQPKEANTTYTLTFDDKRLNKRFTATFIEKIMKGAVEGGRNDFFASVIGTLLKQNMNPAMAYEFMIHINENFVNPKLPDSEINSVFKSILKREFKKGVVS